MFIVLLTNIVSPHQLPLSCAIAALVGDENYRYVHTEAFHKERTKMGWGCDVSNLKFQVSAYDDESRAWLEAADLVYCEEREFDLLEARLKAGKKTFYVSERWLKPNHGIPGWLRLLHPGYFKMVRRFVRLFDYPDFRYLPQGRWAERDMAFLCRIMGRKMPSEKITPWGYFVAPSTGEPTTGNRPLTAGRALRVLWVGRMIGWKRVDTIVRAIKSLPQDMFTLTLVGNGDKRASLERLASGASNIIFKDSLPIDQIRSEMRASDVYVLSSTGEEGWGAALNEAIEEGMMALGTFEAGSSSYMLPDSHKFHAGDWRQLAGLLQQVAQGKLVRIPIGEWSAEKAAKRIVEMVK